MRLERPTTVKGSLHQLLSFGLNFTWNGGGFNTRYLVQTQFLSPILACGLKKLHMPVAKMRNPNYSHFGGSEHLGIELQFL